MAFLPETVPFPCRKPPFQTLSDLKTVLFDLYGIITKEDIMKKRLLALLLVCLTLSGLAACSAAPRGTEIGILTNVPAQSAAAEAAEALAEENETVTRLATWPEAYMTDTEAARSALAELTGDASLGALLLHEAVPGCATVLPRRWRWMTRWTTRRCRTRSKQS